jgi:DNA mismatch repair protein MutS2
MVTLISLKPNKNEAQVRHKNFKFSCGLNELFINKDKAKQSEQTQISFTHSQQLMLEVKCLGMRLDEFQDLIHNYLPALQLEQLPYVIITHGHGDGVLKKWLRKFISKQKEFTWSPIDGNDGQTRIEFKKD